MEHEFVCKEPIQLSGLLYAIETINIMNSQITVFGNKQGKSQLYLLFYADLANHSKETQDLLQVQLRTKCKPILQNDSSTLKDGFSSLRVLFRNTAIDTPILTEYDFSRDTWSLIEGDEVLEMLRASSKKDAPSVQIRFLSNHAWILVDCNDMIETLHRSSTSLLSSSRIFLPLWLQYELKTAIRGESAISDVRNLWSCLQNPLVISFCKTQKVPFWQLMNLIRQIIIHKQSEFGMLIDCGPNAHRKVRDVMHSLQTMFSTMHGSLIALQPVGHIFLLAGNGFELFLAKMPLLHELFFLWTGEHDRELSNLKSWSYLYKHCSRFIPSVDLGILYSFLMMQTLNDLANLPTTETERLFRQLLDACTEPLVDWFCNGRLFAREEEEMNRLVLRFSLVLEDRRVVLVLFGPKMCFVLSMETKQWSERKTLKEIVDEFGTSLKKKYIWNQTSIWSEPKKHRIRVLHPSSTNKGQYYFLDTLSVSDIPMMDFMRRLSSEVYHFESAQWSAWLQTVLRESANFSFGIKKTFHERLIQWIVYYVFLKYNQVDCPTPVCMLLFAFCLQEDKESCIWEDGFF